MTGFFPWSGRRGIHLPHMPALPAHPGGPAAASASPLAGLAAMGIPIAQTPSGRPVIGTPLSGGDLMLPPNIAGMPSMPIPQEGWTGGSQGGGLFQAMAPVAPFDFGNQVRQFQQQKP